MAANGHAKLSPSAAKQWMSCPGSVHLTPKVADKGSKHSDAGTAGHLLFEKCLKTGKRPAFYVGEDMRDDKGRGGAITAQTAKWVAEGINWVRAYLKENPGSTVYSEYEVDPGLEFGLTVRERDEGEEPRTDFWGTGDLFIVSPRRLVVFDLKLGYVEVEVENNQQLRSYALGFEREHREFELDEVLLVICQPQNGGVKEHTLTVAELHAWRDKVRSKVLAAVDPAAPRIPGEVACKWCKAAPLCPELRERTLAVARQEFSDVDTISREQLVEILQAAPLIRSALDKYELHALQLLELGQEVPGYKRVRGRKNRIWKDEKGAVRTLKKLGFDEDDYQPRELLSPSQAETLVGKAGKHVLATFIETPEGEGKLAPADDPRPAMKPEFEALP